MHVKELVENLENMDPHSVCFLIGSIGDEFEYTSNVLEAGYSDSVIERMVYELYRCIVLTRLVRSKNIDIVYTRDSPYFAPIFANLITGVPLVVEANGVPEDEASDATFQKSKKRVFNWVRRTKRGRASRIIAVSDGIRNHLLEEDSTYNLTVIGNGVNVDQFELGSSVADAAPYTICYVGGLQRWQGIETMVKVVKKMEVNADLLIVGGTEDRCSELEQFVREQDIESRVEIVGRVPHEKVSDYINRADLCFGPFVESRKASPLKIYEYVSCGREVVYATEEGLDRIQSISGVHRLSYSLGPEGLAKQIDRIITTVETNYTGRDHIVDNYSWKSVAGSVIEECEAVVSKK